MADKNDAIDALLDEANARINTPQPSIAVQFLDGPLAGQVKQVAADHSGRPRWDGFVAAVQPEVTFNAFLTDEPLRPDYVTYTIKRSTFHGAGRRRPAWVATIGDKVGERVQCVQMYTEEARAGMGSVFDEMVERNARAALERTCAEAGLIPDDVRKVFDGGRRYAEGWVYPRPAGPYYDVEDAARAVLDASETLGPNGAHLQFIVYHAVAMPAPAPAAEAVTQWA
ncbi:hypothetical protein SEA_LESTON_82 [Mycobacterium phage Leston]|uniref:Uncharacterized protein n=1 Tax=Mycobacterium phage Leston TaxID=2126952 RepID=A0A2R4APU2_9CAUD|nr:hypothetical protein I5G73_gp17 [Mycobacterium phage Leston]AVR77074.1 hypothetical protein SEA_LESTON_82 [Mycobacterium phage Leston]